MRTRRRGCRWTTAFAYAEAKIAELFASAEAAEGMARVRAEAEAALGRLDRSAVDRPTATGVGRRPMADVLRIANCSGFYGDRLSAAREMVEGGPIDVLTGDYLAELTLMILLKDRLQRSRRSGYARTFLRQLEEVAVTCKERGIKIVVNAGGLNPAGLRRARRARSTSGSACARVVAHIEGDDLHAEARRAAGARRAVHAPRQGHPAARAAASRC